MPRTVLIVDDEALIRLVAAELLAESGYVTLEACDAVEACAILAAHPEIGVLLTDINMPGDPDGLGLAHVARQRRSDLHIVVSSGRITPTVEQLPAAGRFLAKPYTSMQLLAAVSAD